MGPAQVEGAAGLGCTILRERTISSLEDFECLERVAFMRLNEKGNEFLSCVDATPWLAGDFLFLCRSRHQQGQKETGQRQVFHPATEMRKTCARILFAECLGTNFNDNSRGAEVATFGIMWKWKEWKDRRESTLATQGNGVWSSLKCRFSISFSPPKAYPVPFISLAIFSEVWRCLSLIINGGIKFRTKDSGGSCSGQFRE